MKQLLIDLGFTETELQELLNQCFAEVLNQYPLIQLKVEALKLSKKALLTEVYKVD